MRSLCLVLGAVYCLWGAPVRAERVRLSRGSTTDLPAARIRVRPWRGYENTPLQPPRKERLLYSRGQEKREVIAYNPRELWVTRQTLGNFVGPEGRILVLGMTLAPPKELPVLSPQYPFVREEDFDRHVKPATEFGADALREWVEYLTGRPVVEQTSKVRGLTLFRPYVQFQLENDGDAADVPVYLIQLSRQPQRVLGILFEVDRTKEYTNLVRGVHDVLKSIGKSTSYHSGDAESHSYSMQSRKFQDREKRSPKYEAARKRVIENLKNLEEWWYVETPNYVICSDLSTRQRRFVRDVQEDLEAARLAYARLLPPKVEIDDVSVVRVMGSREGFLNYIGNNGMRWALGLWVPHRNELVISPFEEAKDRDDREAMMRTVFHEGFHQYVYYALGKHDIPIWLNEGHAMLFEGVEADLRRKSARIREVESRSRALEAVLERERVLHLDRMFAMSTAEFYREPGLSRNYAVAWGLVYFLRKGGEQYEPPYEHLCDQLFAECVTRNGDWEAASKAVLGSIDVAQLETDLRHFWRDRGARRRAERNDLFED